MAREPLLEPGDLDVVGLVAVQREPLGVVGHEREPVDLAPQPDVAGRRRRARTRRCGTPPTRSSWVRRLSSKVPCRSRSWRSRSRSTSATVRRAPSGNRSAPRPAGRRTRRPSSGRPSDRSVVDSPWPGGGEDVRRVAARARAADQQPAVLGAGDGDRAAGQVGQHGRAGQRGLGARRDRHPHVLADLDVQLEAGHVGGGEDQVGAERHLGAADLDRRAAPVVARARTSGARRTRGRSAGRTSARRRGPGRGGSPPRS